MPPRTSSVKLTQIVFPYISMIVCFRFSLYGSGIRTRWGSRFTRFLPRCPIHIENVPNQCCYPEWVKFRQPYVVYSFFCASRSMRRTAGIKARHRQTVTIRFIVPSSRQFRIAAASISSRYRKVVVSFRFIVDCFWVSAIPILTNRNGWDCSHLCGGIKLFVRFLISSNSMACIFSR